jgi:hypothetical protein
MPYYYSVVPAADLTTNATANTNTDHLRAAVGATSEVMINALYLYGRASAATNISNTALKLLRASTASTVGTAFTPRTRSSQAATGVALVPALSVWSTAPTAGTFVAAPDIEIGCLSAGAAYWMPYDPDAAIRLAPAGTGAAGNIDAVSQGTAASLLFRYSLEFYERQ